MPRKQQRIKDSDKKRQKIVERLQAKVDKPKDVTLRDFILSVKSKIEEVLEAGYSYEEIAETFKLEGVEVAATTIKTYMADSRSNKTSGKKSKNQPDTPAESDLPMESDTEADEEES
ncbi:hypothetical protein Cri9333_4975 (plasmid) [Crinalium epipsammum PCC 9333]|uniref:Uncharacterized protein n=1 Tax=Crinalium epipsammum PCC 9333 TaxID=1173022 RepID=K9W8C4_9CYAN|nr:hypothetical protein [Crinalium epipsammum]AFZ15730.1 hypothetical protein Cri9333_4975 [Crinalium epipsammum PCC 9333]